MSESDHDLKSVSSVPKLLIGIGTLGWITTTLTAAVIPTEVWSGLFIGSWIVVPVAMIWDARLIRGQMRWPRFLWLYLLEAVVWYLAVVPAMVYLLKRRSALKSLPLGDEASSQLGLTTPRQVVGLVAVIAENLAPLVGVVVFEWGIVPLLVIYSYEAFITAVLAAVKALFEMDCVGRFAPQSGKRIVLRSRRKSSPYQRDTGLAGTSDRIRNHG